MKTHPDAPLYKACPFPPPGIKDVTQMPLPGGRVDKESGKRFCNRDYREHGLVTLADCRACKWHGSIETPPPAPPRVGDIFADYLKRWHRIKPRAGCGCQSLQAEMNAGGPAWCIEHADRLAGQVVAALDATKRLERRLPRWVKQGYFRWLIRLASKKAAIAQLCPEG